MTDDQAPESQPKGVRGEALETEEGVVTPAQQPVGDDNMEGGGEWPDPNAPPRLPAPGAVDLEAEAQADANADADTDADAQGNSGAEAEADDTRD